ncbi:hypothetical protein B0J13DRAFT_619134 [Dactylonectria estremocensis]|uniref:Uncharacterized protein n=1 Tax=Dactylonectria estremocensis TaxID=1079267 RepID=A0A9P9F8A1_9HYPO|nr:hypothetical protein B0J13DRAFT_619134 [Dactylonectria estremocensis]
MLQLRRRAETHLPKICGDSGCSRPIVYRTWLETLDYTIENKKPGIIKSISGWDSVTGSATFTFYFDSVRSDGSSARVAKFTDPAWVMNKLEAKALLGNGFFGPYRCDILISRRQLQCYDL